MITHIEGKLVEKNLTDVVIDCNGIGYLLNISLQTYSQIPNEEKLKLVKNELDVSNGQKHHFLVVDFSIPPQLKLMLEH